jgi:hypothetical protein
MDVLFDRDTVKEVRALREEHGADSTQRGGKIPRFKYGELTSEKRAELTEELHLRRRLKASSQSRQRVVFFGDGSFSSSMRGSASIPKKEFLRLLVVRGPTVLLDEFRTSKMCPCSGAGYASRHQQFPGMSAPMPHSNRD